MLRQNKKRSYTGYFNSKLKIPIFVQELGYLSNAERAMTSQLQHMLTFKYNKVLLYIILSCL